MTNKQFILNILGIGGFLAFVIFGVMWWLKLYTHHGQKLELPDYRDVRLEEAIADAQKKSFQIIVNDSVHIVGKEGGLIQNQNPPGSATVKQRRKIYVTVTKYNADVVDLATLLPIYGQPHEMVKAAFERKGISSTIKGYRYDLTSDQVLEVWQGENLLIHADTPPEQIPIEKGSQVSFVLSSAEGGEQVIPDLLGLTVRQARFVLNRNKLRIGSVYAEGGATLSDPERAIILRQIPEPASGRTIGIGESVDLIVEE